MTAAAKIAEAPEPARYADTERNKIINRTSLDLRKIVHDFDPENDNLDIRVWDRLDQMAQEIEARAADLTDALDAEIAKSDALAKENAKLRGALRHIVNAEPFFHYAGVGPSGMDHTIPGSPYDRGKLAGYVELQKQARAALGDTP